MIGQLTKRQRMLARSRLHAHQKGLCRDCGEEIVNMVPGVVLVENWRRAVLTAVNRSLVLKCQRCGCATDQPARDEELAAIDRFLPPAPT